jgi:glycine cleavage system regulatory protein
VYILPVEKGSALELERRARDYYGIVGSGNLRGITTSSGSPMRGGSGGVSSGLPQQVPPPASDSPMVVADPNTNTLIVTATPGKWDAVKAKLNDLQQNPPQRQYSYREDGSASSAAEWWDSGGGAKGVAVATPLTPALDSRSAASPPPGPVRLKASSFPGLNKDNFSKNEQPFTSSYDPHDNVLLPTDDGPPVDAGNRPGLQVVTGTENITTFGDRGAVSGNQVAVADGARIADSPLALQAPPADIKHFMPADVSNFNRSSNGGTVAIAGNNSTVGMKINGGTLTVSGRSVDQMGRGSDSVMTLGNPSTLDRFSRDQTVVVAGNEPAGALGTLIAQLDPSSPPQPASQAGDGAAGVGAVQAPVASAPSTAPVVIRKVIREGTMEFEVDNFDSTFNQIQRITAEEGGFITSADSDKLNNGKVKGTITVRVPPDRLDTLVLKLRALGELKSQKLGSKDISKQYTDLESELRAARAMETRLLELIARGNGEVKDLLAAEKELGTWRTKIETIQGQINYYNNLVSMATLTVTAYEKDIRTPASADQTEEINAGIETDDVEAARNSAITAVNEAKGRIVESTLQKLEAGQYTAKIIAEVAPENAGPLLDRLRQLGRVARLDIQRKQTPSQPGNTTAPNVQIAKVEQQPTRIIVSMYNLANVAPRLTTNLNLAAADVEIVYRAILARIGEADGRVVSSSLNRQDALNAVGNVNFEVKAAVADAVANDIRAGASRQVLRLSVTENPDTANVTTAKQAFTVQIIPASQVPPRETRSLTVETSDVESAVQNLGNAVGTAGGRVVESSLSQDQSGKSVAHVGIEVPLDKIEALVDTARRQGKVRTAESTKNAQVPDGPLARARLNLTIGTGDTIMPAEAGLWHSLREGLSTSVQGLLWSLQLIVIGLCLVAPWVLVIWAAWKVARRRKGASAPVT